jgi:hypothetical protein
MTDCDCFSKNCKRQFATGNSDHLISAGSPPSPVVIFNDPPSSPPETSIYSETASLESEAFADVATQPDLSIYEPEVLIHESQDNPEVAINENQDIYKTQYEIDSSGGDVISGGDENGEGMAMDGDYRKKCEPEVITINDDFAGEVDCRPEVITIDGNDLDNSDGGNMMPLQDGDDNFNHQLEAVSTDEGYPGPSKKMKMECECVRPDTPGPLQSYSDEDEKTLQIYQHKLLKDSLATAKETYVSLTDLLLYKLRGIDFNSETSKDMLASLKVLGTLNRLYRAANLELDRHREDDYGREFFDI